jgi:hypothetical protein
MALRLHLLLQDEGLPIKQFFRDVHQQGKLNERASVESIRHWIDKVTVSNDSFRYLSFGASMISSSMVSFTTGSVCKRKPLCFTILMCAETDT